MELLDLTFASQSGLGEGANVKSAPRADIGVRAVFWPRSKVAVNVLQIKNLLSIFPRSGLPLGVESATKRRID